MVDDSGLDTDIIEKNAVRNLADVEYTGKQFHYLIIRKCVVKILTYFDQCMDVVNIKTH